MIHNIINNKYYNKIFIFIFITTLICSGASPFVNLVKEDQAILYAIGKCIAKGQVLFRDVCDHKGSYLFFLNAISYLISSIFPFQNFIGLYIFEFISMLVMALYLFKIFNIYLNKDLSFYSLLSFFAVYYYRGLFRFGNRYETWILTMQIVSIYDILLRLNSVCKNDYSNIKFKYFFLHGIFVGIVFNMKMNYIAMWGALIFFFIYLIIKKEYILCFKNVVLGFLTGFIIANIPMLIYCAINNSFKEMFFWSILLNFNYVKSSSMSLFYRLYMTITEITYLPVYVIIFIGFIYLLIQKIDIKVKIYYLLSFVFSIYVVAMSYVGLFFFHYNIYMLPFMIPFFIMIFGIISKYERIYKNIILKYSYYLLVILFIIYANKILGRSKPMLNETERNIIKSIQDSYSENNDLKVYASDNEVYYVYCYTDVVPPKGIVVCSMFLNAISDVYFKKMNSLINDNYDYVVLYYRLVRDYLAANSDYVNGINNMLKSDYDLISENDSTYFYKKHK